MTQLEWKTETTRLIIEAINKLPQAERDAFVWKHYKGMNVEEIAAKLECSVDESSKILHQAEQRLNKDLGRVERAGFRTSFAFC
jgi:RNA polymerase sigma factor (sigma-70 family)